MTNFGSHKKHEKAQKGRKLRPSNRYLGDYIFCVLLCFSWLSTPSARGQGASVDKTESLAEITARLAKETTAAYDACRFSALSKDYFNRFSRDPDAKPND